MRDATAVAQVHADAHFLRQGEHQRQGANADDDEVVDVAQDRRAGDELEAAPEDRDERQSVGGHDRREQQVELVRIQWILGNSENRQPEGGAHPHQQDRPAEIRDGRAFERMQQRDEKQGCHDDAAEKRDDVRGLQQGGAEDFRDQSVEHKRLGLQVDGAHDGGFGTAAQTVIKSQKRRAEGRSRDALVPEHRADAGDEDQREDRDAHDPARPEIRPPRR